MAVIVVTMDMSVENTLLAEFDLARERLGATRRRAGVPILQLVNEQQIMESGSHSIQVILCPTSVNS